MIEDEMDDEGPFTEALAASQAAHAACKAVVSHRTFARSAKSPPRPLRMSRTS